MIPGGSMIARHRYGVDWSEDHEALLAIDEYRERISPDMKGAE